MDFSILNTWETVLFPRFLSESDFKPRTLSTFRAGLRCFAGWCRMNGVNQPDTASLNRWKIFLLERYQTATARTYLSAVRVFCRWLSDKGLGNDIGASVRGIQMEQFSRKDCLSATEMKRLLAHLEEKAGIAAGDALRAMKPTDYRLAIALRDYLMVLLIVSCGLRVSEVSSLDVGDLDTVNGKPVIWVHGKGRDGKSEFLPIPAILRDWLFQYLESRKGLYRHSPMFVSYGHNSRGKRLSSRSISRIAKQAMVTVGLDSPKLTAHSLRHTAVTLALQGGATLQQVQQFARHRMIQTTLRYAHNLEIVKNPCPRLVMKLIGRLDSPRFLIG